MTGQAIALDVRPAVRPPDGEPRPPTEREFRLFQELVYEHAGIHLASTKRALLNGRLAKRVRELGLKTFGAYYEFVRENAASETVELFDRITTNETAFFREPRHFRLLEKSILPAIREKHDPAHPVRILSAGCSTGEEAYSLAMTAMEIFPAGWSIDIVAADLSARVLRQAASGVFPLSRADQIPKPLLTKYMLRGTGANEGTMKAGPELRAVVHFVRANLHDPSERNIAGRFDIVFCRNVLIYFDRPSKTRAVEMLIERMVPGGCLFVGHAETLAGITDRVRHFEPTVYLKP